MHRTYNHRLKEDLMSLRADLRDLAPAMRAMAVTYTLATGIIRPPLQVSVPFKMIRFRFGNEEGCRKFSEILTRKPQATDAMWNSTLDWMVSGKDAYDSI